MACKRSPVRLRYSPHLSKVCSNAGLFCFNSVGQIVPTCNVGKVTGSAPVFSTSFKGLQQCGPFLFQLGWSDRPVMQCREGQRFDSGILHFFSKVCSNAGVFCFSSVGQIVPTCNVGKVTGST